MRISLVSCLWLLPFLSFLTGYQILHIVYHRDILDTPSVVGLHLTEAVKLLSRYQLNARILTEKEDNDIPEGSIISQSPLAGKKIKAQQSVFLVVTRKPTKHKAPSFYSLTTADAQALAQENNIRIKAYFIQSVAPQNTCISQSIVPGQELDGNSITVYFSSGTTALRIFPDLKNQKLLDVTKFLKDYGILVTIQYPTGQEALIKNNVLVIDQRPLAGTIFDIKKPLTVQLTVESTEVT